MSNFPKSGENIMMGRTPKLLVVGMKRHGKDSVCEILRDRYHLDFISLSYYCCEKFLFNDLKELYGYQTVDECFEDRHDKRAEWHDRINAYRAGDERKIAREILKLKNVYCGMRSKLELTSTRDMFDCVVWVDAIERCDPESTESMSITRCDADVVIANNGPEAALPVSVSAFYGALKTNLSEVLDHKRRTSEPYIFGE